MKKMDIKKWYEENKEDIKYETAKIVWWTVGCGVGYILGTNIATSRIANGYKIFHEVGLVKFFNPETGIEIGVEEACKISSEICKKTFK